KAHQRPEPEIFGDFDAIDTVAEELGAEDENSAPPQPEPPIDPKKLAEEIVELESYRILALQIGSNAKGRELISALPKALDQIVGKGGERKAVIFTESVRTQRYLAELLAANGYDGEIVLLNGQNNDPASRAIYEEWLARHKNTDAVSGSRSADMKAAIVE